MTERPSPITKSIQRFVLVLMHCEYAFSLMKCRGAEWEDLLAAYSAPPTTFVSQLFPKGTAIVASPSCPHSIKNQHAT